MARFLYWSADSPELAAAPGYWNALRTMKGEPVPPAAIADVEQAVKEGQISIIESGARGRR